MADFRNKLWTGALLLVAVSLPAGRAWAQGSIMPLVPADEELATFLGKAEKRIAEKDYENAITYLNALIQRTDAGFMRVGKSRRFLPIRHEANRLLGTMPPDGLNQYRKLYDPQAAEIYRQARQAGDMALLRQVADRYQITSYGLVALEALAEMAFDRGLFTQASWYWQEVLAHRDAKNKPMLLTKLAAAAHLSGQPRLADNAYQQLKAKYADKTARIGRREQKLVDFVQQLRKTDPAAVSLTRRGGVGWPGLWSLPGQMGLMDDADVVLIPRWFSPESSHDQLHKDNLREQMIALKSETRPPQNRSNVKAEVTLDQGHAKLHSKYSNRNQTYILPAAIHPIVVGEQLIYRTDEAVVARDVYTGEMVWRTFQLPLTRERPSNSAGRRHYYYYGRSVMDNGRYSLTVGDGKIYTLGRFRPYLGRVYRQPNSSDYEDNSCLSALDLSAEGRLAWTVGRDMKGDDPQGSDELLRGGKFLTVPACSAGRLFTMVKYMESYWLACLDSDTGELIWKTRMAQTPPMPRNRGYNKNYLMDMGTPPALADGRVFVINNAGVIGCFDQRTGQPVWAYQYDSELSDGQQRRGYSYMTQVDFGVNPILVHQGRVVVLPADSSDVICLSAEDGQRLWQTNRRGLVNLTGIDESRVLLSGTIQGNKQSLVVLSTRDGKVLAEPRQAVGIHGRPAVTPEGVIASGMGKLVRMDLKNYSISTVGPAEPDALLGNLVSVRGKIFAANPLGICAYFGYDVARQKLSERLASNLSKAKQAMVHLQMGQLAYSDKRFGQALEDLRRSQEAAGAASRSLRDELADMLLRTHLALGNAAGKLEVMKDHFDQAQKYADSPRERAHMLIRMIRYHELAGVRTDSPEQMVRAVDLATRLIQEFPDVKVAEVQIGAKVDPIERIEEDDLRLVGRVMGDKLIQQMIRKHGRSCYEAFDVKAGKLLDKALAEKNPEAMVRVARTYKHSKYRDEALFAAAEHYYVKADAAKGDAAQEALSQAVKYFSEVHADESSPLRHSATVALAAIYAQGRKPIAARLTLERVRDLDPDTPIEFGNVRGRLGKMIEQIENGKIPQGDTSLELKRSLITPLEVRFDFRGKDVVLIRDENYRPIRIGQSVLVLKNRRAMLVNTSADSAESSVGWVGLTSVDGNAMVSRYGYTPPEMSLYGGLSDDGKTIVVSDRDGATGFETSTGKRKYHVNFSKLGANSGRFTAVGMGQGKLVVVGNDQNIHCLDIATGKRLWKASHPQKKGRTGVPIRIESGLVVVPEQNRQGLAAFDAETGKLRLHLHGRDSFAWFADGKLLTISDGQLSLWAANDLDKPIWKVGYNSSQGPGVLAVTDGRVYVAPSRTSRSIEVRSLAREGKKLGTLHLPRYKGKSLFAVRLVRLGEAMTVVLATDNMRGGHGQYYGKLTPTAGLYMVGLDGEKGQARWTIKLPGTEGTYNLPFPMIAGEHHVLLTATINHRGYRSFAIDARSGQIGWSAGKQINSRSSRRNRLRTVATPAMTSGYMVAEDENGVKVYGPQ
jgi:outer membrane protein assembly factor BamB